MSKELAPCPVCGRQPFVIETDGEEWFAECNNANHAKPGDGGAWRANPHDVSVGGYDTEDEAIAAWNKAFEREDDAKEKA